MDGDLVLMYHSVEHCDHDPFRVTVSPDRFAGQLRWLRRAGWRGVAMRDLLRARAAGTAHRLVGLTFDDGYADFVTEVMPALARHGFTATVFVLAGRLGGANAWDRPGPRKALMTAGDVRRAADAGMEIGSHGLLHRPLPAADRTTLAAEVGTSRATLRALCGQDVRGFCYPYGAVGAREVAAVRMAGYEYACAVGRSTLDVRYAVPRVFVGDRDGAARLAAKWLRHRIAAGGA
ncbi:polysaccharide deacetylase family protein [Dactylosporangium siamense]|uniref:Polysaccharide deacetylase n=1 Tax=Dactylosporangium siamense TaxID=685454 RepID=A0A919PKF9_9ACTN|nr:polysaccharide deacetylase family protein [Dactylosporangium siamense]GIG43808.1 polysaccharide deacetylase [Dactylosporangium siamense]